jgi:hypothetical protein
MKIKKMSDEECLSKFVEFLEERISITTNFVVDPDTDLITHQLMVIKCGDLATMSHPEQLELPLRVATGTEIGATVN